MKLVDADEDVERLEWQHSEVSKEPETVDVIDRKHGKWEEDSDGLPVCSICGEIALQRMFVKLPHLITQTRMILSNYCPNCGAKMEVGNE